MKKKGAVSLSTKVIIGLVVGIPIVLIILSVGAKVVSLVLSFPNPDDEDFNELVKIINTLDSGDEEKNILYFINKEHFLAGFDEDTKEIEFGWFKKKVNAPLECTNKEKVYGVCICKCDRPIKEDACRDSDCELIENDGLYYIECIGCKNEDLLVEGSKTLLVDLKKEGDIVKFVIRMK